MSKHLRDFWGDIKDRGESIGYPFFILGILGLLTLFGLVIAGVRTEIWLLGTSLGLLSVWLGFTSIGIAAKSDKWSRPRLAHLLGTVEEGQYAELDLARSPQSRSDYQLTGAGNEDILYDSKKYKRQDTPFLFGNAWIRLDLKKQEDVVRIRLYITEDGEESQASKDDENTYSGIYTGMVKIDGNFYNKEGITIKAEQLAGSSPVTIGCYVYDAMRGG